MNMFTVNCKINGHLFLSGIFKQMSEYLEYTDDIYLLMIYILIVIVIVSLIFYYQI